MTILLESSTEFVTWEKYVGTLITVVVLASGLFTFFHKRGTDSIDKNTDATNRILVLIAEISSGVKHLESTFKSFQERIDKKIDKMESKLEELEKGHTELHTRIKDLEKHK